jgi:hypothetical protein
MTRLKLLTLISCGQELVVDVDDRLGLSTGLIGVAVIGPRSRLVPFRQVLRNGLSCRARVSGPCQMRLLRNAKGAAFLILDVDPGGR